MRRAEIRLTERAVREWTLPDEAYTVLPERLFKTAISADRPDVLINATRVLAMMHSQNQQAARPAPVKNSVVIVHNPAETVAPEHRSTLADAARVLRSAIPAPQ